MVNKTTFFSKLTVKSLIEHILKNRQASLENPSKPNYKIQEEIFHNYSTY